MAEARKTPETTEKQNSKCLSDEQPQVNHPASAIAAGACTGVAVGIGATAATVPIAQALGFTTAGIAAESVAAGMMSSAAIAGGGGVASGIAVATLQSIGAAAAVPMGIAALTISIPTVVGLGVAGIVKTCRSGQHESVSAYEAHHNSSTRCWFIATEEGCGNVRVCRYNNEEDARDAFSKIWRSRVLYNPQGEEVQSAGINGWATDTVRRVIAEKYLGERCDGFEDTNQDNSCESRARKEQWIVATEEGWGNVCVYRYNTEKEARDVFDKTWCSRVLYNAKGEEVQSAGINVWATNTVRRVMADKFRQTSTN